MYINELGKNIIHELLTITTSCLDDETTVTLYLTLLLYYPYSARE